MSLETEVKHTVGVTNLVVTMMEAQGYDRTNCACGVAIMASILAGEDQDAKTMLAHTMLKLAIELDADLVRYATQLRSANSSWGWPPPVADDSWTPPVVRHSLNGVGGGSNKK